MPESCEETYPLYDENSECDIGVMTQLINMVCTPDVCGRYYNPDECNAIPGCTFGFTHGASGKCKDDGTVPREASPDDCSGRCCKNLYMDYYRKCVLSDHDFRTNQYNVLLDATNQRNLEQLYQSCENRIDFDISDGMNDHGPEGQEGIRTVSDNHINRLDYNYDCTDQIIYCGDASDERGEHLICSSYIPFDADGTINSDSQIVPVVSGPNEFEEIAALQQIGDCPVGYEAKSDHPGTAEGIESVTNGDDGAGYDIALYRRCARKQGWDCNNLYGPGH